MLSMSLGPLGLGLNSSWSGKQGGGAFSFYVNTLFGSDASDGKSPATAKKTIAGLLALGAALSGVSVGLCANSVFTETLAVPYASMRFGAYGVGASPITTANDTKTWTQGPGQTEAAGTTSVDFSGGTIAGSGVTATVNGAAPSAATVVANPYASGGNTAKLTGNGTDNRVFLVETYTQGANDRYLFARFALASADTKASTSFRVFENARMYVDLVVNASKQVTALTLNANTGGEFIVSNAAVSNFTMDAENTIEVRINAVAAGVATVWLNDIQIATSGTKDLSAAGWTGLAAFNVGNDNFGGGLISGGSMYVSRIKTNSAPIGAGLQTGLPTTVWYCTQATDPLLVAFGALPGIKQASTGALNSTRKWYWDDPTDTLYVYSVADPTTTVTVPTRSNAATVTGKANVSFNGITFRGGRNRALLVTGASSGINVQGCTIELAYFDGFQALENSAAMNSGVIANNTVRYNGASGINGNVSSAVNWDFSGNTVYENGQVLNGAGGNNDHLFIGGIKLFSQAQNLSPHTALTDAWNGTKIYGNTVYRTGSGSTVSGGSSGYGNGIWPDTTADVEVYENRCYDNFGNDIFMEKQFLGSRAHDNVAFSTAAKSNVNFTFNIGAKVSDGNDADSVLIDHNTAYGGYWALACDSYQGNGASKLNTHMFRNNIGVKRGNSDRAMWIGSGANNDTTNGTGNVYIYNAFGPPTTNFLHFEPTNISTYAGFDTAYGAPSHNISGDPLFVDAANGNFTLQAGSPCIGAGNDNADVGSRYRLTA